MSGVDDCFTIDDLSEENRRLEARVASLEVAIDRVLEWDWIPLVTEDMPFVSQPVKDGLIETMRNLETARGKR